jgi:hypothetical protein
MMKLWKLIKVLRAMQKANVSLNLRQAWWITRIGRNIGITIDGLFDEPTPIPISAASEISKLYGFTIHNTVWTPFGDVPWSVVEVVL